MFDIWNPTPFIMWLILCTIIKSDVTRFHICPVTLIQKYGLVQIDFTYESTKESGYNHDQAKHHKPYAYF